MIDGISANIPVEELVAFITKKANPPVTVKTGQRTDGKIILEFENSKQASTVYRLHGIPFAGGKLYIRYYSKPMARNTTSENGAHSSTNQSIDLLRSLVTSRFHAESRRLDFDRIIEDPVVKKEKIKVFDQHNPQSKFGPVLCKIIQEVCPNLETLSLSGNKLCTLDHFSTLYQRVPSLVNLSLQDNMISSYRDLEPLHAKEFPNLREVVLIGNPLRERELSRPGGEINYTSYIKKLFPTINILDMQPVLEEIQFDVVKPLTKLPLDTKCGFMGSDSTRLISQQFLQMFYSLFDTNRAGLADFYGDNAVLSLSVDTARPLPGNRGAFQSSARQSDKALDSWAAFNRNLYKIKQPEKRVTLAYVGQTKIIHALGQIPGTLHPLGDPPERKKFLVEAINGVAPATYIHITVHGEFKDLTASALLSFDRTFIIVPAIPGSRSAMASLPFTITNDSWAIRRYSSNYAWSDTVDTTITASSLQPTHSTPISNPAPVLPAVSPWPQLPDEQTLLQYRIRDNLNEQQHTLVVEFAKATGLNYSYSLLCLQQTGWSAEAAGQAFLTAKNMIPPEAFKL
ncbi:nuclear mRNA export, poly(A)+RNA binding protein, variant 2 [Batrachochytrium dendrobatidis]|nr:nuclear mRNA export, poly(A)+RNA binding protein, variant 2 [Batrachochytrium dendrobatidis]